MISGLELRSVATFGDADGEMQGLKKLNFVFGSNGTGKTTISKLIADPTTMDHSVCVVNWLNGRELDCFVYNRDFVERNFHEENLLKGIFTLGEEDSGIVQKIEEVKAEADDLDAKLRALNLQLNGADGASGKKADREKLEADFREKVWPYRQKFGTIFETALKGTLGSKSVFADRLLKEAQDKSADLRTQDYLEERAASVFEEDTDTVDLLSTPDASKLCEAEQDSVLSKKVIGKEDVDIAAMIQRLNNSDWVREGLGFFDINDEHCPFCQRKTEEAFRARLTDYFDDAYTRDLDAIKVLRSSYSERATQLAAEFEAALSAENVFLDKPAFKAQLDLFIEKSQTNIARLAKKEQEPSAPIELVALGDVSSELAKQISETNEKTKAHNELVENRGEEQKTLKREVWRFVVDEAEAHIDAHRQATSAIDNVIETLTDEIDKTGQEFANKTRERQALEARVTSVKPTVDAINGILNSYAFESFKLREAEKTGFYEIVRPDGQDAHRSLSEGEKTFITFLYFYQLLQGSLTESEVKTDRVAVFDDPISSLDSEILFIVSTLIRNIIQQVRDGGQTKQVFVMTHNVYFHKEVTYEQEKDAGFWLVSKRDNVSRIRKAENGNPVKTAYEMLWLELEDENLKPLTVRNTLRRILEYYFKTIGGIPLDDLPTKFDGNEQLACRSLLSWIHDGSHCLDDGINVITGDEDVQRYLAVFEKIFEKTKHVGHYKMMKEKAQKSAARHYGDGAAASS